MGMATTIDLKEIKLETKWTGLLRISSKEDRTEIIDDISYEDKVSIEQGIDDFKKGKTVSHKKMMKFLRS